MQSSLKDFILRLRKACNGSENLRDTVIKVGWVDTNKKHKTKKSKTQETPAVKGDISLVELAKTLNFGRAQGVTSTGHKYPAIPARPFMKNCIDNHLGPVRKLVQIMARDMLDRKKAPLDSREQLEKIGLMCKGALQRSIKDSNEYAPNSPRTVRAKGSARPLIDTGLLLNSIDYEIKD